MAGKTVKPVYEITKRKQICTIHEAAFFVVGSLIYIAMFIPICYYTMFMPEYDTENVDYRLFFKRDTHFTTIIHTGKFTLWMIMCISGFAFVNLVNLMNQRRNPFRGRDGTYGDFKTLVIAAAAVYLFTPHIVIRAPHDMQRDLKFSFYWEENLPVENRYPGCKGNLACVEPYPILPEMPGFLRFLIREVAFAFKVFGFPVSPNCCYLYTTYEVVFHNMLFVIFFTIGMNYTHVDFPPFSQFGFTKENIRNFTWVGWAMSAVFFSGLFLNMYYVYHTYTMSNSEPKYWVLTAIVVVFAVIRTILFRNTHYIHFHHWTCGFVALLYLGFQNNYF